MLIPHDGGLDPIGDYCGDHWPPDAPHCRQCGSLLDFGYASRKARLRGKWDIAWANTRIVASERFREFCLGCGTPETDFRLVNKLHKLYEVWPRQIVEVDRDRSKPEFSEFCISCGNFGCYLLGDGLYLSGTGEPLKPGFYRTDLVYGCGMDKTPLIIAAPETTAQLRAAKFRLLRFRPIPYWDPL